jgi:hypothetical protein
MQRLEFIFYRELYLDPPESQTKDSEDRWRTVHLATGPNPHGDFPSTPSSLFSLCAQYPASDRIRAPSSSDSADTDIEDGIRSDGELNHSLYDLPLGLSSFLFFPFPEPHSSHAGFSGSARQELDPCSVVIVICSVLFCSVAIFLFPRFSDPSPELHCNT